MSLKRTRQITGILFILGAILVNIPYTQLIINFDYPDILREPAGVILEAFAAGSPSLVWIWLAFAWVGLPILVGVLLLPDAMEDHTPLSRVALFFGAMGAFVQMLGFSGGVGQALKRKSGWLWIVALTGVTFAFFHTLINPRGELAEALESANVIVFLCAAAVFIVGAFGLWLFFRNKAVTPPGEELDR